ncbi:MAG: chorismate synthase [Flavobacteriales bacterium]|nr:chorismate synthase [Flavobacteriales bacterium]
MNSFGTIFRISVFGESHGPAVGVTMDGCPHGIALSEEDLLPDLERRKSGAKGTTPRTETDSPEFISGVHNGHTTGAPLTVIFRNGNVRSADYDSLKDMPRPGHADLTARVKFKGFNDPRGGGHFSGRLTVCLVAAGAIAKKVCEGISIRAKLVEAGGLTDVDAAIDAALTAGDSIGGIIECRATGIPAGLGEPFFNSVESVISHLAFSIPAIKGIEFGSGFGAARTRGSVHNDSIIARSGKTSTNNAGGINGGITNGNELIVRIAVKPTSSIGLPQRTVNMSTGALETLVVLGRHDVCIALRVPVVAEAITAIALADLLLQKRD